MEAVVNAAQQIGEIDVQPYRQQLRERMEKDLASAKAELRYADALKLARLLPRLTPDDPQAARLPEELATERRDALDETLDKAAQAIRAYRPEEAEQLLKRATTIAQPEGDRRIDDLERELTDMKERKSQADQLLEAARWATKSEKWETAIEIVQEATMTARGYGRIARTTADIQALIQASAKAQLLAGRFKDAQALCDLGLKLGPDDNLNALRSQIIQERERHIAAVRERVGQLLSIWAPQEARALVEQELENIPDDKGLTELLNQINWAESKVSYLKQEMEKGWAALQKRDLNKAQEAFNNITREIPEFRLARVWLSYIHNLEQAIQIAERDPNQEEYPETVYPPIEQELRQAWETIRLRPDEQLPTLWPDLAERHRQAAWDVSQMAEVGKRLTSLCNEYKRLYDRGKVMQALDLVEQIDRERKDLLRRYHTPTPPPPSFRADTAPSDVQFTQPPARPEETIPPVQPSQPPAEPEPPQPPISPTAPPQEAVETEWAGETRRLAEEEEETPSWETPASEWEEETPPETPSPEWAGETRRLVEETPPEPWQPSTPEWGEESPPSTEETTPLEEEVAPKPEEEEEDWQPIDWPSEDIELYSYDYDEEG